MSEFDANQCCQEKPIAHRSDQTSTSRSSNLLKTSDTIQFKQDAFFEDAELRNVKSYYENACSMQNYELKRQHNAKKDNEPANDFNNPRYICKI